MEIGRQEGGISIRLILQMSQNTVELKMEKTGVVVGHVLVIVTYFSIGIHFMWCQEVDHHLPLCILQVGQILNLEYFLH